MIDLTDLHAKVQAANTAIHGLASQVAQAAAEHDGLLSEVTAAMEAKPTLADIQALVNKVVAG